MVNPTCVACTNPRFQPQMDDPFAGSAAEDAHKAAQQQAAAEDPDVWAPAVPVRAGPAARQAGALRQKPTVSLVPGGCGASYRTGNAVGPH
jgi:hypothetical protein